MVVHWLIIVFSRCATLWLSLRSQRMQRRFYQFKFRGVLALRLSIAYAAFRIVRQVPTAKFLRVQLQLTQVFRCRLLQFKFQLRSLLGWARNHNRRTVLH